MASTTTGTIGAPEGTKLPWMLTVVIGLAAFMEVLDMSIANVSLQNIAGSLAVSPNEATWVLTSYLVANAIILPMSGWFSKVLGRKRYFLISILIFSISSLFCGMAPTLGILIVARIFQGLGGGGLQPVSQAILADEFPASKRGMAFAMYGIAVVVAPAIGPTLGGWITDNASWHWIFLLNVPVGALLFFLSTFLIKDSAEYTRKRKASLRKGFKVDYLGFALLALGLGCLQIMLDKGQQEDWLSSHFILALAAVSIISITILIVWEWYHRNPIIDVKLFKNSNFAVSNLLMFMLGFILLGSTVLIPLFVQSLMGYTALLAGLVLSPGGIAVLCMMPIAGLLSGRVAARWQIIFGLVIVGTSMLWFASLNLQASFVHIMWIRVFQGLGLAFMFIPISNVAYIGISEDKTDQISAFINLARNVGGSVGISIITTKLSRGAQEHQDRLVGHATSANHAYNQLLQGLTQHFHAAGADLVTAGHQAHALVYSIIQKQALLMSYLDDFRFLGFLFIVLVPLIFLLKNDMKANLPDHTGH